MHQVFGFNKYKYNYLRSCNSVACDNHHSDHSPRARDALSATVRCWLQWVSRFERDRFCHLTRSQRNPLPTHRLKYHRAQGILSLAPSCCSNIQSLVHKRSLANKINGVLTFTIFNVFGCPIFLPLMFGIFKNRTRSPWNFINFLGWLAYSAFWPRTIACGSGFIYLEEHQTTTMIGFSCEDYDVSSPLKPSPTSDWTASH